MMHIDTHKAFNKLVDAGLPKEAAETIIGVIEESRKYDLDNLATKQDIAAVKQDISTVKQELSDVKSELKQDIANVRLEIANVRTELKEEFVKEIGVVKEGVFEAKLTAAKFHSELREEMTSIKGKFNTMQWMMTFMIGICSAILLKLFWGVG